MKNLLSHLFFTRWFNRVFVLTILFYNFGFKSVAYTNYNVVHTYTVTVGRSIYVSWNHAGKCTATPFGPGCDQIVVTPTNNGARIKAVAKTTGLPCVNVNYASSTEQHSHLCNINVVVLESVTIPSMKNMTVGETYTITPLLNPSVATTDYTWHSSNTDVADVTDGKVIAKSPGVSQIQCMTHNGKTAICTITVSAPKTEKLTMPNGNLIIKEGEHRKMEYLIEPESVVGYSLNWVTNNPSVAQVTPLGEVIGISPGIAIISATTTDGSNLLAYRMVSVECDEDKIINLGISDAESGKIEICGIKNPVKLKYVVNEGWSLMTAKINEQDVSLQLLSDKGYLLSPELSDTEVRMSIVLEKNQETAMSNLAFKKQNISIDISEGNIIMSNTPSGSIKKLYDMNGVLCYKGTDDVIYGIKDGVYILECNGNKFKIIIR